MKTNFGLQQVNAILILFFICLCSVISIGQEIDGLKVDENGNVGVGTTTPHTSAKLQIYSKSKGFLLPQMTIAERESVVRTEGLIVYINDDNTDVNGPYYWDETSNMWIKMDATSISWSDIPDIPADLDDQNLTAASLDGTLLTIEIEDGDPVMVDLLSLGNEIGSDDQNLTSASLVGTSLTIEIEDGDPVTVDLLSLGSEIGSDDQNLTAASLDGTLLTIEIENGDPVTVDLLSLGSEIGSDDQNLTSASLNGTELTIEIEDGDPVTVNLEELQSDPVTWITLTEIPDDFADDEDAGTGVGLFVSTTSSGEQVFTFFDDYYNSMASFTEGDGIELTKVGGFLEIASNDGDPTNELQTLNFDGTSDLEISNNGQAGFGNTVDLSALKDDPNAWKMNGNATSPFFTPKLGFTFIGDYPLRLYTNNQERMRIASDGKVGIGTSNPLTDLEVVGNLVMNRSSFDDYWDGTVSIGPDAGIVGHGCNFIGPRTGMNNDLFALDNNFIGNEAGKNNVLGERNNFIGMRAGFGTGGTENNFIGYHSGYNNDTGNNNNFFGSNAGENNVSGENNIFLGTNSGRECMGCTDIIAIGTNAYDVNNSAENITNSIAFGTNTYLTQSNEVILGNYNVTSAGGSVTWSSTSDERLKDNIVPLENGLKFILGLNPVQYNMDMDRYASHLGLSEGERNFASEAKKASILYSGFLAQKVEELANSINYNFSGVDKPETEQGLYGLRYAEFVVPLVKAVQEQQEIIQSLGSKVSQQSQAISAILTEIERLKERVRILEEQ